MSRLVTLTVALLLACGGKGEPSPGDEPDASMASADAALDGPSAVACDTAGDCPCFSNHDCPETHACTSLDDTGENVFCLEGPRGTGVAGVVCTGESDCASALCIEDDSGSFCSDLCEDADECPAELPRCLYIGFGVDASICAPL